MNFQWYPGHMTKAKRQMQEDIKLIDLVVELVDARIPLSSRNPDIDELGKNKYRLILMNKSDLADPRATEAWSRFFKDKGYYVVSLDARSKAGMKSITDMIMEACKEKIERDRKRGIKNRPVRAMVVGIPNVGKSTFISVVSEAKPIIADYHFTTITPVLGVVTMGEGESFVVADIPGLIEGASDGVGLGHEFLRHVERCRMLLHIIDAAGSEGRDPIEDFEKINTELEKFDPELSKLPQIVAANKIDMADEAQIEHLREYFTSRGYEFYTMCAPIQEGTAEVINAVAKRLKTLPPIKRYEAQEIPVEMFERQKDTGFTVREEDGVFIVEAPWLLKILQRTDMDDYESLQYFQRVLHSSGILDKLESMGIQQGDTVEIYDLEFDYMP